MAKKYTSKFTGQEIDEILTEAQKNLVGEEVTYEELKSLRDTSQLIPERLYRITDYECTTSEANTTSAGHQFDIIVRADDVNILNEEAGALHHEGDTYFSESDLEAWQLGYCLDNDTNRFAWTDSTNGKGVIYRIIDEGGNDVPYDFKNIQYVIPKTAIEYLQGGDTYTVTREESLDVIYNGTQFYCYKCDNTPPAGSEPFFLTIGELNSNSDMFTREGTRIDYGGSLEVTNNEIYGNFYTFGGTEDATIKANQSSNNIIKPGINNSDELLYLNRNRLGNECYNNIFGENCHSNIVGDSCYSNTFSDDCYSNIFGSDCYCNTFGENCCDNIFGNQCSFNTFNYHCGSNIFGNGCKSNTFGNNYGSNRFGNNCESNNFGNNCRSNTFGENCCDNTFGDQCNETTFGDDCYSNIFGNTCYSNTFGDQCNSNIFGNQCNINTFGDNCYQNTFGNKCNVNNFGIGCFYNTFGDTCHTNTFDLDCESNTFGDDCYSNTFGNGCGSNTFSNYCHSNKFDPDCSSNTFGNFCYSNIFNSYCSGNTFGNNCSENTFGSSYIYNTFGNNCSNNTFGDNCNYSTFGNGCSRIDVNGSNVYLRIYDYCSYLDITLNPDITKYVSIHLGIHGTSEAKKQLDFSTFTPAPSYEIYPSGFMICDSNGNVINLATKEYVDDSIGEALVEEY